MQKDGKTNIDIIPKSCLDFVCRTLVDYKGWKRFLTKKNPLFRFGFKKPRVLQIYWFFQNLKLHKFALKKCLHVFGFGKAIHSLFNIGENGGFWCMVNMDRTEEFKNLILVDHFWMDVKNIILHLKPIFIVLHLIDRNGCTFLVYCMNLC